MKIIQEWLAQGYECIGGDGSGAWHPCRWADVPDGAIWTYLDLNSPEAVQAIESAIADGWNY